MRIIAGEFRGRPLKSLKGDATRPTTDRVREALMSSLVSARGTLEGARVLRCVRRLGCIGSGNVKPWCCPCYVLRAGQRSGSSRGRQHIIIEAFAGSLHVASW